VPFADLDHLAGPFRVNVFRACFGHELPLLRCSPRRTNGQREPGLDVFETDLDRETIRISPGGRAFHPADQPDPSRVDRREEERQARFEGRMEGVVRDCPAVDRAPAAGFDPRDIHREATGRRRGADSGERRRTTRTSAAGGGARGARPSTVGSLVGSGKGNALRSQNIAVISS